MNYQRRHQRKIANMWWWMVIILMVGNWACVIKSYDIIGMGGRTDAIYNTPRGVTITRRGDVGGKELDHLYYRKRLSTYEI